jgi:peptide/nickel transport system substrate-binding protein
MIASNLCDDLFRLDPMWGEHPELAQSYSYPNPTTLVLNIRHDGKFWDGKPVTAADVAYSLNRNMNPSTGAVNGGFFMPVATIVQSGPYQVTVHFKTPDELFIKELATVVGAVVEKAYVQKVGDKSFGSARGGVMCSGPYKLQSWTPGQQMVLVKNGGYWDSSLEPKIDRVTVKFISNTSTLTSALSSGEIDGAYEVPALSVPALRGSSAGKLYFGPGLAIEQIQASTTTGPAANPTVREALGMTLDRAAIAQKIYNGAAAPNLALTPPNSWSPQSARSIYAAAYNQLPGSTPDVARAKQLIASVPNASKPIVLAIQGGDQTSINLATLIQQYAAQIGLNLQIKQLQPLDFSNLFYEPQYRKGIGLVLSSGFLDIPDQLDYLPYWIYPNSTFNWIDYKDPKVQSVVNQALATFDPQRRATLLVGAQALYMKDQIVIPILSLDEVTFLNSKLGGATTSFAYLFEPSFAYLAAK